MNHGIGATAFTAPAQPGAYGLKFDLVAEGVTWFGPRGTRVEVRPLQVVESDGFSR